MVRKIIIWFTSILIVLSSLIPMGVSAKEDEDYKTMLQSDSRWASLPLGTGGYTIGKAGCAVTSVTMLMAFANPSLRNIEEWNPGKTASTLAPGGLLVWGNSTQLDSTFTLVESTYSFGDALSYVLDSLKKGYYVIIYTPNLYDSSISSSSGQHYSPVVGVKDGKPQVWDVGVGLYNDWDTWVKCGITQIVTYKSSLNSSDKALKGMAVNTNIDEDSQEYKDKVSAWSSITKELDLLGMDKDFKLAQDFNITLPTKDSLSKEELVNIENIRLNIDEGKVTIFDVARYGMAFAGLVLMLYGILLILGYIFDSANTLVEISLLGVLTLGRYRLWGEDLGVERNKKSSDGKLYCTLGGILVRVAIIEGIGLFLVSSGIFRVLYEILVRV